MDPCAICGAVHEEAASGDVCAAACIRALAARVSKLEGKPETFTVELPEQRVVSLSGGASGSGDVR